MKMDSSNETIIPYSINTLIDKRLRPLIKIKFDKEDERGFLCLLDSGADYSTFPQSIGKKSGIDFDEAEPIEPPKQISGNVNNKCYQKAAGIYLPDLNQTVYLTITWIDSPDVDPVIGRIGFFDKFKEVAFDEKNKKMILRR